jgi:hypothetical protein
MKSSMPSLSAFSFVRVLLPSTITYLSFPPSQPPVGPSTSASPSPPGPATPLPCSLPLPRGRAASRLPSASEESRGTWRASSQRARTLTTPAASPAVGRVALSRASTGVPMPRVSSRSLLASGPAVAQPGRRHPEAWRPGTFATSPQVLSMSRGITPRQDPM